MNHPGWLYPLLWLFSSLVLVGLIVHLWTRPQPLITRPQALTLLGVFLLTLGVHVGYNFTFVQHQGRYLFPALIPLGFAVGVGLGAWLRPLQVQRPFILWLVPIGLGAGLVALDLYALFRVIVPALG